MAFNWERRMQSWDVNPQLHSRFFVVFPMEIRLDVYRHALQATIFVDPASLTNHDYRVRYDHNGDDDGVISDLAKMAEISRLQVYGLYHLINLRDWFDPAHAPRPGHVGRPRLSPKLLLTCRRFFIEARPLFIETTRCFWWRCASPPHPCQGQVSDPRQWRASRRRWERQFAKVHLFCAVTNFNEALHAERHFLRRVEHLRITVRKDDWTVRGVCLIGRYRARHDSPLLINPLGCLEDKDKFHLAASTPTHQVLLGTSPINARNYRTFNWFGMEGAMKATESFNLPGPAVGTPAASLSSPPSSPSPSSPPSSSRPSWLPPLVQFVRGMWAREFVNMPRIKTFTMDFDTTEDRREELATIVEWAIRTWRFPLNPNHAGYHYLSADGNPVQKMSWRGTYAHWDNLCLVCKRTLESGDPDRWECEGHRNAREKFTKGLGPRMYTWTVTWTPRRHDGPEVYPYQSSGCLEVAEHDIQNDRDDSGVSSDEDEDEVEEDEGEAEEEKPASRERMCTRMCGLM